MYEIEQGFDMPKGNGKNGRKKYPFPDMDIGDSFFVSADKYQNARNAASGHSKKFGKVFSFRKTEKGARCWRMS